MLQLWLLLLCCLLTLGDALNCSVTGENGRTTYIISDLPEDSAGGWDYTWANATNHVIANNQQEVPGLVLKNTNTTLQTSELIEGIVFTGFIDSTGDRYTARCQITNTENAPWKNTEFSHNTSQTVTVAAVVLSLLLLVLLVVLIYKFRDKIPSRSSRSPPAAFTALKTADPGV